MKASKNIIASFFCLIFILNFTNSQANGQDLLSNLLKFNQRLFNQKTVNQTPAPTLEKKFDNFINQARTKNSVRVIVGLRVENYQPDAALRSSEQIKQRLNIKQQQQQLLNRLSNFEVVNPKLFEFIPFVGMEISADALTAMRGFSEITSIEEDIEQKASLLESIPLIGAPAAWNAGFTGQGRTVAVLDTGVDKFHPFFNNRVVSEACYSTTTATTQSVCPGGAAQSTAANSGLNCDVNQIESCNHGTHVAGITAGGHPQINGAGVARNANIIAIQVFSTSSSCSPNPAPCTTSFNTDTIKGLERVYALRTTYTIDAVNMSLGGGRYYNYCDSENASYKAAIDNLRAAGIATIVASGNEGYTDSISSPACISTAISVGSTNDGSVNPVDWVSSFSNSAIFLNLLAPGEQIQSAVPGGSYGFQQGTSQAAPHVAGAWVLMKQKYPSDTVTQTLTRIKYGGVQVTDSRTGLVKPRLKVDTALNTSNVDPCNSSTPIIAGQTINGSLSASDCIIPSGSRNDVYTFTGNAGQGVAVSLSSSSYLTYLYLFNASGNLIGQNGNGFSARIPASGFLTLPTTGTYYIYATSVEGNKFGNYSLSLTTNAPTCNFSVSSSGQSFAATGGSGSFNVSAPAGCAWTAQSSAAWLSVVSGGSGNGGGTVNYSVAANSSTASRTATITTGGQIHTVTQSGATVVNTRRAFDFDGDGKSDISVFRPSNGVWYLNQTSAGFTGIGFGLAGDKLVPADYDGDGKTDVAVYRNGMWYLLRSSQGFTGIQFGDANDIPVPADYDGDGKADVAVFRPSNGYWYLLQSSAGFTGFVFGINGDKPVPADYDGDGKADTAVVRNGIWYLNRTQAGFTGIQFGDGNDKPVQADYDGDGKTDLAVFRPSNGYWYLLQSSAGFTGLLFGISTDLPTPADYDGDGKADVAVFRPSNGYWYLQQSSQGFTGTLFGTNDDKPAPNSFVQ